MHFLPPLLPALLSLFLRSTARVFCAFLFFLSARIASTQRTAAQPGDVVPVPNVSSKVLKRVVEYCQHHVNEGEGTATPTRAGNELEVVALGEWDKEFMAQLPEMGAWRRLRVFFFR